MKSESLWTVWVCSVSNVEEVQRKDWSNSVNSESLVNFWECSVSKADLL